MNDKYMNSYEYNNDILISEKRMSKIPECLNDDFCVPTPKNRNDGILTMAFVDMQPLDNVYSLDSAFKVGTLFPNLDKPFYGGMQ